jgi:hypothetical protein
MDKLLLGYMAISSKTLRKLLACRLPHGPLSVELNSMNEVTRSPIACAILGYLLSHPEAQDTLAGIVEWWLPERRVKTQTAAVKEVLSQLVDEQLIIERKGTDSQLHYRINTHRMNEIEELLK